MARQRSSLVAAPWRGHTRRRSVPHVPAWITRLALWLKTVSRYGLSKGLVRVCADKEFSFEVPIKFVCVSGMQSLLIHVCPSIWLPRLFLEVSPTVVLTQTNEIGLNLVFDNQWSYSGWYSSSFQTTIRASLRATHHLQQDNARLASPGATRLQ